MAEKVKYVCEFVVNSSPKILFNFISSPGGLAEWFCNDVNINEDIYTFIWVGEGEQQARLLHKKDGNSIRFKWLSDEEEGLDTYFELALQMDDLTGDVALMITDFAEPVDVENDKLIWESQIQDLSHVIGV